ncbi:MAG: cytochrome c3 family protein [Myxococcales bacterium]
MSRRTLLLLLLAVPALALAAEDRAVRSYAIYPEQKLTVAFNHQLHIEQGMECDSCHGSVSESGKASDLNLPKEADCETCHDIAAARDGKPTDPPAACVTCHPGFDPTVHKAPQRWVFPDPNLRFPHDVHVKKNVACDTCHGDVSKVGLATRQNLPKMETCLKCHDNRQASARCETCHLKAPDRRLQQAFANTPALLRPIAGDPYGMAHGPRFEREHAAQATAEANLCAECHSEAYCLRCHDGRTKPLNIHPNDFMALHPVAARLDNPRCDSCHRRQSFCAGCHERVGIGQQADPALQARNVRVHPPAEIWVLRRGPNHHGAVASRDIGSCVSCHREESCMACHSSASMGRSGNFGFSGINPHPPDFAARCASIVQKNARACLKCHTANSPELARCR